MAEEHLQGSRKRKRPDEWNEDEREEIEKETRIAIEEALSNCVIQTCPHCHTRATVTGVGCNNVLCACLKHYCYRCGRSLRMESACCSLCYLIPRPFEASKALKRRCPGLSDRKCRELVAGKWKAVATRRASTENALWKHSCVKEEHVLDEEESEDEGDGGGNEDSESEEKGDGGGNEDSESKGQWRRWRRTE